MSSIGLPAARKVTTSMAGTILSRLRGGEHVRADVIAALPSVRAPFEDPLTEEQWLEILSAEEHTPPSTLAAHPELAAFLRDVASVGSNPALRLPLIDAALHGGAGAWLALALLVPHDQGAAAAFEQLRAQFDHLPPDAWAPNLIQRLADRTVGGAGRDDLSAVKEIADAAASTPAASTGERGAEPGDAEDSGAVAYGVWLAGASDVELVDEHWDEAVQVAERLAKALRAGGLPQSHDATWLLEFATRVRGLAADLDVQTRDDLSEALAALSRHDVDPTRMWLLRLVELSGPEELGESIAAIASFARDASLLPEHERDDALQALLVLIDMVARREAAPPISFALLRDAKRDASSGLPEQADVVEAAGLGMLHVPTAPDVLTDVVLKPDSTAVEGGSDEVLVAAVAAAEPAPVMVATPVNHEDPVADEAQAPDEESAPAPAPAPAPVAAHTVAESSPVVDATVVSTSLPPAESDLSAVLKGDPWLEGQPPLIAELIASGRERMAYLVGEAYGLAEPRMWALRLFCAAYGCRAERVVLEWPELILEAEQVNQLNADDRKLLLAATVRLALTLGYSPIGPFDQFGTESASDGYPESESIRTLVSLAGRGFVRSLEAVEADSVPDQWHMLGAEAERMHRELAHKQVSYQRASNIVHYLARDNQVIGRALLSLVGVATSEAAGRSGDGASWAEIREITRDLKDLDTATRFIESADYDVSSPQQRRKAIIASARDSLYRALGDVAALLGDALALRSRTHSATASNQPDAGAFAAARSVLVDVDITSVGDAALQRLIEWVRSEKADSARHEPLDVLLFDELAPLFEIPRDESGRPTRHPTAQEVAMLVAGRDSLEVLHGYLRLGNIQGAEAWMLQAGIERDDTLDDEIALATRDAAARHRDALYAADRVVSRLRALKDDDIARDLAQQLDEHRDAVPGRADLSIRCLESIQSHGSDTFSQARETLVQRANALADRTDAQRILGLVAEEDEPLAVEFLTFAEAGEALPDVPPPSGDDFVAFFPGVVEWAVAAAEGQGAVDAVREHLGALRAPDNRVLNEGLTAWTELRVRRQGAPQDFRSRVDSVLRMVGLIPAPQQLREITKTRRAGYTSYQVRATPIGGSYVPSLGTQARGQYDITLVWDEVSPQRLLQFIDEDRRDRAHLIFYFRTLSVAERIELRRLTRSSGVEFSPLVVDDPVVAWLSTRPEASWKITQRVTLPFTTLNPYTPFAGGEVPDEVFVGREIERQSIIDPTGSLFVYGGRQLGKSALLRRVERGFTRQRTEATDDERNAERLAVYFDLKTAGIGEASPPSALWPSIAPRLVELDILHPTGAGWSGETVTEGIAEWLEADPSRQLLLLLDESDNFLTADARDVGRNRLGGFPTLQQLKGLMERTHRRFKPVFAGLHQVQRFHDLPNTPVAHGGQDILIGPLRVTDARELVRDPLYALGYEFETRETMWRLLRLTNYQASLIQIICDALVRHVRGAALPGSGGRVVITNRHVDEIYAKREVRDLIAQRFRWTINLDSRYRVIALVTALWSFDARPGEMFSASELQRECAYFWPAAFSQSDLSSAEFLRYLDEMTGLGVLHRQGGDFGLRSPSVLGLLGTRDSIETELMDAENFELDYQYNPAVNRRILAREEPGPERRSPLSDAELALLTVHAEGAPRIHAVIGTPALGIGRVSDALTMVAADRGFTCVTATPGTLDTRLRRKELQHVILDLTDKDATQQDFRRAITRVRYSSDRFVTIVVDAKRIRHVLPELDGIPLIRLRRWSAEGLQSWQDSLFSTPLLRQQLKAATGGWPDLVERVMHAIAQGSSREDALMHVAAAVRDPKSAVEFLIATRVDPDVARTWNKWLEDKPATYDDVEAAEFGLAARTLVDQLQFSDVLDEHPSGGWVLDRLVLEAAQQLPS
ncbi:MAG: hypothetical protein HHJ10_13165 [Cellulomonas sp.]|uniref:hypothetical protein n=1 Tax=Cellulomonas sp. TaxID=40001 RepID=UPI0017960447|nr:hypothetical protein [Cellulomonas sp.]NMM31950.1 hypothetical protein [Cellulomonas sp.]